MESVFAGICGEPILHAKSRFNDAPNLRIPTAESGDFLNLTWLKGSDHFFARASRL